MNGQTVHDCIVRCVRSRLPVYATFDDQLETLPCLANSECLVLIAIGRFPTVHWTLLCCKGDTSFYFDSLAKAVSKQLTSLLDSSFRSWSRLSRPIQSEEGTACGNFCIYACLQLLACEGDFDRLEEKLLRAFSGDRRINDCLVSKFVKDCFKA